MVRAGEHTLQAYLAAYWSTLGKITPLDGPFTPATAGDPALYLHDMSVLPELSGQGVARYLVTAPDAPSTPAGTAPRGTGFRAGLPDPTGNVKVFLYAPCWMHNSPCTLKPTVMARRT